MVSGACDYSKSIMCTRMEAPQAASPAPKATRPFVRPLVLAAASRLRLWESSQSRRYLYVFEHEWIHHSKSFRQRRPARYRFGLSLLTLVQTAPGHRIPVTDHDAAFLSR